jgi:hypothetical protein
MISIILSAAAIAACLKWGAWKRWREFYPTILYVITGNLVFCFVFRNYLLWSYNSFLGETYIGLINIFLIYPPVVILYLTHYPEEKLKQLFYILGWTAAGSLVEAITLFTGGITYHHGWNMLWSALIFLGMLILLRLHYKKSLAVWPISLLCGIAASIIFALPFPLE